MTSFLWPQARGSMPRVGNPAACSEVLDESQRGVLEAQRPIEGVGLAAVMPAGQIDPAAALPARDPLELVLEPAAQPGAAPIRADHHGTVIRATGRSRCTSGITCIAARPTTSPPSSTTITWVPATPEKASSRRSNSSPEVG